MWALAGGSPITKLLSHVCLLRFLTMAARLGAEVALLFRSWTVTLSRAMAAAARTHALTDSCSMAIFCSHGYTVTIGLDFAMAEEVFTYGALGESWWAAAGAELKASAELVKFACARHQGASAAAAARLAGIKGTAVSIRQAGYRMLRTTTVSNLLALAAAEDSGIAGGITATEIDAKLAKMIRSPDHNISIRAIESHARREAVRRDLQPVEEEDVPEETLSMLFTSCRTIEAVLLCYAEMMLCGNPGKYNRIGVGFGCHSPMMAEMIPHLAHRFPEQWKVYRAELVGSFGHMNDFVAKLEAGPLLSWDEIGERARVKAQEARRTVAAPALKVVSAGNGAGTEAPDAA
jgi:hypothetical protein